jgi:hypothetical protein
MFELLTEPSPAARPARRRLRALAGGLGIEDAVTTENENENSSTGAEEARDGD